MYDAVGNQTVIGTYSLAYDADNHMVQATDSPSAVGGSVQYFYDADVQRAVKEYSDGGVTIYVYDAFGQLAAQYFDDATTHASPTRGANDNQSGRSPKGKSFDS